MMRPDSMRITGALLFSLLVHGLLLGLAGRSGRGTTKVPAARRTVFMRLVSSPEQRESRPAAVPARTTPGPVAKRVPKQQVRRPRPVSPPVARPVSPVPVPSLSPPVKPSSGPPPVQVSEISEPAPAAAAPAEAEVGGVERQPAETAPPTATESEAGQLSIPDKAVIGGPGEGGVLVLARPLYRQNPPPSYPGLARRRGWQGTVVLAALVGTDGRVADLNVQESSGHRILDEAARAAVRNWRFKPGRRGGRPEAMQVLVPVRFGLE